MRFTGYADFWFRDVPLPERVTRFAQLGIRDIDVWAWRSKGIMLMSEVADACRQHGCALNSTFDEAAGSLTDSYDLPLCLDAWGKTLAWAQRWDVRHLFAFSEQIDPYVPPPGVSADVNGWVKHPARNMTPGQRYANLLDGLGRVMELVQRTRVVVWLEALNTYHLHGPITVHTHEVAADVVRRVNHPQLRMAFDCYHQQRTSGNLIQGLRDYAGLYDTVHVADVPTRQEPGTGEINYHAIAGALRELGYDRGGEGLIGLEFYPSITEAEAYDKVKRIFGV